MFRTILLASVIAAPGLLWAGSGHADLIKRGFLLQSCRAKEVAGCDAYIAGVADLASMPSEAGKPLVCIANGVKTRPVRESVVSFLESHPGPADGPAAPPVLEALRTLYKC